MSQTAYNLVPGVGYEGMIADNREACIIVSRLAQGLVPVGKLCAPGTDSMTGPPLTTVSQNSMNPGQIKALPVGITDDPILGSEYNGIPIYEASRPPYDSTLGYACYSDKDYVSVLQRGPIYVAPEAGAFASEGDVWVRVAAGAGGSVLGRFAPAAGAGLVKFGRGRWQSGLIQGNLAVLFVW